MVPPFPVIFTSPYDPAARAFFARQDALGVPVSASRKPLYNNVFVSLRSAGLLPKLDTLYLMAAENATTARQNLIQDAYNLSTVNGPTFTVDRGYAGDGSSSYLKTGFVPNTAGGRYSLNSSHFGTWSRTNATSSGLMIGARDTATTNQSIMIPQTSGVVSVTRMNQNTVATGTEANSLGSWILRRLSSSNIEFFGNAVSRGLLSAASTAMPSFEFYIDANNNGGTAANFCLYQLSAAHIGGGLSDTDVTNLYNILNTYLTAVGGN